MTAELMKAVDDALMASCPDRNTFFQFNFFNLGKEPTIQGKIHACLNELKGRRDSLRAMELELTNAGDQIELLGLEKKRVEAKFPEEEWDIRRRMIDRKIVGTQDQILKLREKQAAIEEEVQFFLSAFKQLAAKEAPRPWDDFDVQLQYWNARYAQEMRTRIIMGLPPDLNTVKCVMQLPDSAPIKAELLQVIREREKKLLEPAKAEQSLPG